MTGNIPSEIDVDFIKTYTVEELSKSESEELLINTLSDKGVEKIESQLKKL